jgi:hypothetical protein
MQETLESLKRRKTHTRQVEEADRERRKMEAAAAKIGQSDYRYRARIPIAGQPEYVVAPENPANVRTSVLVVLPSHIVSVSASMMMQCALVIDSHNVDTVGGYVPWPAARQTWLQHIGNSTQANLTAGERKDKISSSQKRLNNVTKKLVQYAKGGDERSAKVELATKNVGHDIVDK